MRNHKHNLMALLLAAAILLSPLSLNFTALADSSIKLDCSGGKLSGNITLNAGDALPNYEKITKAGYTFGGWYATPDYSGSQVFVAEADTTYYARWVVHNVNGVDFEELANDADLEQKFNYRWRGNNTVSLNTDGVNVYGGTKSLYIKLIDWTGFDTVNALDFSNQDAYPWWDSADQVADGFCFWISTSKEVTFEWHNQWSSIATVTVPAGKHILTIPKTNNGFLVNAKFRIKKGKDTEIYIDSIGSFTSFHYQGSVILEKSGGTLAPDVTVDDGDLLPNYEEITKDGYTFGGWYATPDYSGTQIFFAEEGKTYYARWVKHTVNGVDFEELANDTDLATKFNYTYRGSNTITLNTDGVNVYDGTKSLHIRLINWTGFDSVNALDFSNRDAYLWWDSADAVVDGYCFWISASKEVTFEWHNQWSAIATITVPAGKHIITVPKINNGFLYNAKLRFKKGTGTDVYIDSIGSFTSADFQKSVILNTCGGTLDFTVQVNAGDLLPNSGKITKDGCIFDGWYATSDYSGSQVFTAEADRTYYARWIKSIDYEDLALTGNLLAAGEKIVKPIPAAVDGVISLTFVAPAQGVKLGLNGVYVVLNGQNSSVAFGNNISNAISVADDNDGIYNVRFLVRDTSSANVRSALAELTVNGERYCITLNGASLADGQNNVCIENISSVAVSVEAGAISLADNDDFALIGNVLYTDHAVTLSDVKNALDDESKFTFSDGAVKTGYSFARNNKALTGNYSVAVRGDINADGNINVSDLVRLKKAAANTVTLSDAQALAATFGKNESIGARHLADVRKLLLEEQHIPSYYYNMPLKKGINFGGLNFDVDISNYNYMLQAKYYDLIREKGFDHIRVPVDFFRYMGSAPDYKIDEAFLSKMDTIITLSLGAGLKIVLDAHHFAGDLQTNVKGELPRYLSMWEQLSARYRNYPSGLVFELINEPGNWSEIKNGGPDVVTPQKIMSLQEQAIKIIRKTNPTRLIVHATQWNNGINQLMDTEPLLPDDKNIIMSVHDYYPGAFTHQGAAWSEYEGGTPGGVYWNDGEMRDQLEQDFAVVKAYQEKYGRPVWVGEFGAMRNQTPEGQRALYAKALVEIMNDAKCGWCWFDFSSNFGLFDLAADDWYADGVADILVR